MTSNLAKNSEDNANFQRISPEIMKAFKNKFKL